METGEREACASVIEGKSRMGRRKAVRGVIKWQEQLLTTKDRLNQI